MGVFNTRTEKNGWRQILRLMDSLERKNVAWPVQEVSHKSISQIPTTALMQQKHLLRRLQYKTHHRILIGNRRGSLRQNSRRKPAKSGLPWHNFNLHMSEPLELAEKESSTLNQRGLISKIENKLHRFWTYDNNSPHQGIIPINSIAVSWELSECQLRLICRMGTPQ